MFANTPSRARLRPTNGLFSVYVIEDEGSAVVGNQDRDNRRISDSNKRSKGAAGTPETMYRPQTFRTTKPPPTTRNPGAVEGIEENSIKKNDHRDDVESILQDDFDYIENTYGNSIIDGTGEGYDGRERKDRPAMNYTLEPSLAMGCSSLPFGKTRYDYDGTRQPRRSSLKRPARNTNRNSYEIPAIHHSNEHHGGSRSKSPDSTRNTLNGVHGSTHIVRVRRSLYPVQRRRSIQFQQEAMVQEVTPALKLVGENNRRELWLQDDEVRAIKERRRSLVGKYKEAQKQKQVEESRTTRQEHDGELNCNTDADNSKRVSTNKMKKIHLNPICMNLLNALASSLTQNKRSAASSSSSASLPSSAAGTSRRKHPTPRRTVIKTHGFLSPPPSAQQQQQQPELDHRSPSASSIGSSASGSDTDSLRGLEKYIDRSGKLQKKEVWNAVLLEQDEQEQLGYYDDEKIAHLYRNILIEHDAQKTVLDRARKDRIAADSYLMTPRTMKLMNKVTMTHAPVLDAENIVPLAINELQPKQDSRLLQTKTKTKTATIEGPPSRQLSDFEHSSYYNIATSCGSCDGTIYQREPRRVSV